MLLKNCLPENECPQVFENLPVLFYADWQGYEESGSIVIFDLHGELFVERYGYCVMAESNEYIFDPQQITMNHAVEYAEEWLTNEDAHVYTNLIVQPFTP